MVNFKKKILISILSLPFIFIVAMAHSQINFDTSKFHYFNTNLTYAIEGYNDMFASDLAPQDEIKNSLISEFKTVSVSRSGMNIIISLYSDELINEAETLPIIDKKVSIAAERYFMMLDSKNKSILSELERVENLGSFERDSAVLNSIYILKTERLIINLKSSYRFLTGDEKVVRLNHRFNLKIDNTPKQPVIKYMLFYGFIFFLFVAFYHDLKSLISIWRSRSQ
ncbi:MAG: hypothetical protein HRU19_15100 [Pseudobacteriovorax sp.]|nr:hypothetical protein [Pseudobacteriovorax sp.]